jgi:methyl-coenzyme M reductase subunit D
MEIDNEETIDGVKEVCEEYLPFGFNIHVGMFIRKTKQLQTI